MQRVSVGFLFGLLLACAIAGHASAQPDTAAVPWTTGPVDGVSLGDWTARWWRRIYLDQISGLNRSKLREVQ